jgi:dihydroorotate dehydrogenase
MTNPGIEWWIRVAAARAKRFGYAIVGSIASEDINELGEMAAMMNDANLVALEFNPSSPNFNLALTKQVEYVVEGCRTIKEKTKFPLLLKLSVAHDYKQIARETEDIVEAIGINSVPWSMAFPMQKSPLAHLGGGGVSGKIAQVWTWKMLADLAAATKTPIIGPSVWEYRDIENLRGLGAKAISFGTIFMRYPWRPTAFVRREVRSRN